MLMIELPGFMTRPQACASQYEPLRLTSITDRNCSGVSRVAGTAVPTPALLINTSTRPKVCIAASTSAWPWLGHADVGRDGQRLAATGLDERRGVGQSLDAARPQHDVGAGLGEGLGKRHTEPGRGAGHDHHFVVESKRIKNAHG